MGALPHFESHALNGSGHTTTASPITTSVSGVGLNQSHGGNETLYLNSTAEVSSNLIGNDILLKAHAITMTCTWLFVAGVGVLLARYYRDMWPMRKICRAPTWFGLHRIIMPLVLLLTIAGITCIILYEGGFYPLPLGITYFSVEVFHPVMGLVVFSLTILNPLMALFRPRLDDPKRKIYNWAHWCVGTSAHIMAVVNITTGITFLNRKFRLENSYMLYVIFCWMLFHFFTEIILQCARCYASILKTKAREREKLMQDEEDLESEAPCSTFRKVVLGVYIVVTMAVCTYMGIEMGLSTYSR